MKALLLLTPAVWKAMKSTARLVWVAVVVVMVVVAMCGSTIAARAGGVASGGGVPCFMA
jgi:hypothetical protein